MDPLISNGRWDDFLQTVPSHLELIQHLREAWKDDPAQSRESAVRLGRFILEEAGALSLRRVEEAGRGLAALERGGDPGSELSVPDRLTRLEAELRALLTAEPDRCRVLVVEDEPVSRALILEALAGPGRDVLPAETGAAARALLAEGGVDLVVLDLVLPDVDGRSLLMELRHEPVTRDLPVLVLSARGGRAARWECLAYGARGYLEKPVDPRELSEVASTLLRERTRPGREEGPGEARIASVLSALRPRWELLQAYRGAWSPDAWAARGGRPGALAVLEVEAGVLHADPGPATARLLGRVATDLNPHLGATDVLGRWSVHQLAWLAPERPAPELRGILKELAGELEWPGDEFRWAVVEPGAKEDGMEVVSRAIRTLRHPTDGADDPLGTAPDSNSVQVGRAAPVSPLVLVVEDDPVTAGLLEHRLGRSGFQVEVESDGRSALEAVRTGSHSLVILDIQLPGLDGFGVLTQLRADPGRKDVPVLMLTSLGRQVDVSRAFQLGADDYLMKPFSPSELLARAHRLVPR